MNNSRIIDILRIMNILLELITYNVRKEEKKK